MEPSKGLAVNIVPHFGVVPARNTITASSRRRCAWGSMVVHGDGGNTDDDDDDDDNDEKKSNSKRQKRKEISPLKPVKIEDEGMGISI